MDIVRSHVRVKKKFRKQVKHGHLDETAQENIQNTTMFIVAPNLATASTRKQ